MLKLYVDNRIRICGELQPEVLRQIQADFTYKNPDFAKAEVFGFRARIPEVLYTWRKPMAHRCAVAGEVLSVPRGGLQRVKVVLDGNDIEYTVQDRRERGAPVRIPGSKLLPRDYQARLVSAACHVFNTEGNTGTVLWRAPQASGKTSAALMVAAAMGRKTLVIVSNSVLFAQWQRRVKEELGCQYGMVGGGKHVLDGPIVIAMQQSLRNVTDEELRRFGLVISDEIQLFAAPTFEASVDRIPAAYRLGISGDERRADHKEFLIYDQFGPVTVEVKHAELVDQGQIHEVQVRVVPTSFDCDWWHKIDALQRRDKETEEQLRRRKVQLKMEMQEKLQDVLERDEVRKHLVVHLAKQCVADAGNAIVLSTRRDHCHILDAALTAAGMRSGLLIGGPDYKDQFAQTLQRFQTGLAQVAVGTYQAIGVGFDLPIVARGICAAPAANSQDGAYQWRQYRGRFARTADGKADAAIYYLLDYKVFGLKPLRHLLWWNADVVVRAGDNWVPGRQWLKEHGDAETKRHEVHAPGFANWQPGGTVRRHPQQRLGVTTANDVADLFQQPQATQLRRRRKRSEAGR